MAFLSRVSEGGRAREDQAGPQAKTGVSGHSVIKNCYPSTKVILPEIGTSHLDGPTPSAEHQWPTTQSPVLHHPHLVSTGSSPGPNVMYHWEAEEGSSGRIKVRAIAAVKATGDLEWVSASSGPPAKETRILMLF